MPFSLGVSVSHLPINFTRLETYHLISTGDWINRNIIDLLGKTTMFEATSLLFHLFNKFLEPDLDTGLYLKRQP